MTSLSLAARNFLAQQPEVTSLLGSDATLGPWVFDETPEVNIESSSQAMIVVSVDDGWANANRHNTSTFPRLLVDIWVDPSRSPGGAVLRKDAGIKAEKIYNAVDKFLHQIHNSTPGGGAIYWGTQDQISGRLGVRIVSSTRAGEPNYRKAFDDQGAVVATVRYNIVT